MVFCWRDWYRYQLCVARSLLVLWRLQCEWIIILIASSLLAIPLFLVSCCITDRIPALLPRFPALWSSLVGLGQTRGPVLCGYTSTILKQEKLCGAKRWEHRCKQIVLGWQIFHRKWNHNSLSKKLIWILLTRLLSAIDGLMCGNFFSKTMKEII